MQFVLIRISCIVAVFCLVIAGCGSGGETASIAGTVTTDGTPLSAGMVVFSSDSMTCSAMISDGRYQVNYQGKPTIPLGNYTVTVFPPPNEVRYNPETDSEEPVPSTVDPKLFPQKYRNKVTSGISFSPELGANEFPIVLDAN